MELLKMLGILLAMVVVAGFGLCGPYILGLGSRASALFIVALAGVALLFLLYLLLAVMWKGIRGGSGPSDPPSP